MKQRASTSGLSFIEMMEENVYFVDKSMLIADLLSMDGRGVYLFTRPRRFGKTTNLTMLDAFFNLEYKGNTWFDGLEISNHPEFDRYRNAFPVINLNLKNTKAETFESYVADLKDALNMTFDRFRYLMKSDLVYDDEKETFDKVIRKTIPTEYISGCIPLLCRMLERHHGVKPIILIDEYDRAVSDSFGSESHRPMMNLLGKIMGAALKNNTHLQMAYVTGVMQIAKESIFSDLNNIRVNNIFSTESDEMFGFTEAEVKRILSDYGHPERFEEAKSWYDGYRFGDVEVYNPFSIMNYVSEKFEPASYWVNSGGDWIVRKLLKSIDDRNYGNILKLLAGEALTRELSPTVAYSEISGAGISLYSLMTMTGYLRAVPIGDGDYNISLPNREVRNLVTTVMGAVEPVGRSTIDEFNEAVLEKNGKKIESALGTVLLSGSYFNLVDENSYVLVVMTLMHAMGRRYDIRTEVEQGNGRIDLIMRPRSAGTFPMVMEFKKVSSEKELVPAAEAAIKQIHEKKYYLGMEGDVILMGMSFFGKIPRVLIEAVRVDHPDCRKA